MEQLKVEEILELREKNKNKPVEKKKPCKTCKKKKEEITEKLPVIQVELPPDVSEIKLAYEELTSYSGVKEDKKPFISRIYKEIFNEELEYNCGVCVSTQARKFKYYITEVLKEKI